jgi:hypothetical protein
MIDLMTVFIKVVLVSIVLVSVMNGAVAAGQPRRRAGLQPAERGTALCVPAGESEGAVRHP